jgi:acetyl-CoA synthetase
MNDNKDAELIAPIDRPKRSGLSKEIFDANYKRSIEDPISFWKEQALSGNYVQEEKYAKEKSLFNWYNIEALKGGKPAGISWFKTFTEPFSQKNPFGGTEDFTGSWFVNGKLNLCFDCSDRWAAATPEKNAIYFISDDEQQKEPSKVSYSDLHQNVIRYSLLYRKLGIQKGNTIAIWFPPIPEFIYAFLGAIRIGAIPIPIYSQFTPLLVKERVIDCKPSLIITCDVTFRGKRVYPICNRLSAIFEDADLPSTILIKVRNESNKSKSLSEIIGISNSSSANLFSLDKELSAISLHKEHSELFASVEYAPEMMDSEDILFGMYISVSSGKPKCGIHTIGGFGVYLQSVMRSMVDFDREDTMFSTIEPGWIAGLSLGILGPLFMGATCVLFEGLPNHPSITRYWDIIESTQTSHFITTPTTIRTLISLNPDAPMQFSMPTLRVLGVTGEIMPPHAWKWLYESVGKQKRPIIDLFIQTETGAPIIGTAANVDTMKIGAVGKPFFGIVPKILDDFGNEVKEPNVKGFLCVKKPWPGIIRTMLNEHTRFLNTYFGRFNGYYYTGDGALIDSNGNITCIGRLDDLIKVSGLRISLSELETALSSYSEISEAAVVPIPHSIKGQAIYAYLVPKPGVETGAELEARIREYIKNLYGEISQPETMIFVEELPRTRSGKIIRKVLKSIALDEPLDNSEIKLANPESIQKILTSKSKKH